MISGSRITPLIHLNNHMFKNNIKIGGNIMFSPLEMGTN